MINNLELRCSLCSALIDNIGYLKIYQNNKKCSKVFLCQKCISEQRKKKSKESLVLSKYNDKVMFYNFIISPVLPKDAYPLLDFTIDLKGVVSLRGCPVSVFDVDEIESETVINKTKLVDGQSWEGCKIGKDIIKEIINKDIPEQLSFKEFNSIIHAVPYKDKNKLDYKPSSKNIKYI